MSRDYLSNAERLIEGAERAARAHWRVLLVEGVALVLFGVLALFIPPFISLGLASSIGWILLFGGIAALIFYARIHQAPGYRTLLSAGVLGVVAGFAMLARPLASMVSLTVVLVVFFVLIGIVKLTYPLERFPHLAAYRRLIWASGALDLVLAAVIFIGLPANVFWAPGLLLAANMILGGIALIVLSLRERWATGTDEKTPVKT